MKMKKLDVETLITHRKATNAYNPDGTQNKDMLALASGALGGVIQESVELMKTLNTRISKMAEGSEPRKKTTGLMYELMVVTAERARILKEEAVGKTYVRSALEREDYEKGSVPGQKKRGIDMIIHHSNGKMIYQLKNHQNPDEYADEIVKVCTSGFGEQMDNIDDLLEEFSKIAEISQISEENVIQMRNSYEYILNLILKDVHVAEKVAEPRLRQLGWCGVVSTK